MKRCALAAGLVLSLGAAAQGAGPATEPPDAGPVELSAEAAAAPLDAGPPLAEPPADAGSPAAAAPPQAVALPPAPPPQPPQPQAPPPRVQVSESLSAAYHLDNGNIAPCCAFPSDPTGSNYFDWFNKLQLDASWGSLIAQLRLDSAVFANKPVALESDQRLTQLLRNRYSNRLDLEKASLRWSSRYLDVTLGDSYATFGRGLVLSLRKVDEFGVDTAVRGLNANLRVGGFSLVALGGWSNIVNVDASTARFTENPNDGILGARAEYKLGRWVTPGLDVSHVIYAQNAQSVTAQQAADTVTSFSGTLDFPNLFGHGTLYAELAGQRRVTQGDPQWTSALYASGSVFFGPATVLVEFKDYRRYSTIPTSLDATQVPELALSNFYTAPPTLERVQQLVLNNTDVWGGHVRGSVRSGDVVPFVSMATFSDRTYRTIIFDPYAGVELRWGGGASRASLSGGWRGNMYGAESGLDGQFFQSTFHGEFDVTQHLSGPFALELSGLHFTNRDLQGPNVLLWHQGQVYLAVKQADRWSAAVGYEYYTETPKTIRPHYLNASGTWHVMKNLLVRGFIGGQRAGIKCVNGVCRNFPAFDGARLEVVTKF